MNLLNDPDYDIFNRRGGCHRGLLESVVPKTRGWEFKTPLVIICAIFLFLTACNQPPKSQPQTAYLDEDSSVEITLNASDPDGTISAYEITSEPMSGRLQIEIPNVVYVPNADYFGSDSFSFKVRDDDGVFSDDARVNVVVNAVNDSPLAQPGELTLDEDSSGVFVPEASDVDGSVDRFGIAFQAYYGKVSVNGRELVYTPQAAYHGPDNFSFVAIDNEGAKSEPAKVEVLVTSVNDSPIADTKRIQTDEDVETSVRLSGTDADGSIAGYEIVQYPGNGQLREQGSRISYTPNRDFHGQDTFTYRVIDDENSKSQPASVHIVVNSVNDAPMAHPSSWITQEDSSVSITLSGQDNDNSIAKYQIVSHPQHGSLSGGGANWIYRPKANFYGNDSFTFKTIDEDNRSSPPAQVNLQVDDVPDPPRIRLRQEYYDTYLGDSLVLRIDVEDPDDDVIRYRIHQDRGRTGRFSSSRGPISRLKNLRYEPLSKGTHLYEIQVEDSAGLRDVRLLTIRVRNAPPTFNRPNPQYRKSKGVVEFTLDVRDVDGTVRECVIETIDGRQAKTLTVTERGSGSRVFQGPDPIRFRPKGQCRSYEGGTCQLVVQYTPDVLDGHSRRIRFYAYDDQGDSSRKDFVRIETRALE